MILHATLHAMLHIEQLIMLIFTIPSYLNCYVITYYIFQHDLQYLIFDSYSFIKIVKCFKIGSKRSLQFPACIIMQLLQWLIHMCGL